MQATDTHSVETSAKVEQSSSGEKEIHNGAKKKRNCCIFAGIRKQASTK